MARPTVLVADTNDVRRKELCRGLAEFGYEVVAAENAANAMRFATGLSPHIIVASSDLDGFRDGTVLRFISPEEESGLPPVLVLLQETAEEVPDLPEHVVALEVGALTAKGILRKIRTLLIALEVGLEPDNRLESIIGDLQLQPLFELLPQLQKVVVSGRLLMDEGEIALSDGGVVAARAGTARGRKAFCRLSRTAGGTFRLLLGGPGVSSSEFDDDLLSLMALAMEDRHRFDDLVERLPDWSSKVRLEIGPSFFATKFSPVQQSILEAAQAGRTISGLVEAVDSIDGEVLEEIGTLASMGFVQFDEPEIRVRVVTDSTADLAPEAVRRNRIHVIPLAVIFDKDILKDGIDVTPGGFYKMLKDRSAHPRTNPPTRGEFLADYRRLLAGADIVSIHISERMSQTVVHAREAARDGLGEVAGAREDGSKAVIEVVDGRQVSSGLGLIVLMAARMVRRGLGAAEVARRIREMVPRVHLLFVVDTLEYLARGGRIGKAQALLGGILGIKPILGLVDGEVAPVDRVRGGKAAHPRVIELLKQRVDPARPVIVGIGHAAAPVWAERLRGLVEQAFTVSELVQGEIGPVVGTHTGPGCVGAVVFQPTDEEAALVAPLEGEQEGETAQP